MAEPATIRRHWWAAALIGLVAPGLGQLYTGRSRLAGLLVAAFFAFFALFLTGVPMTFAGFVFAFGGGLLVSWGGLIEAGLHAWRHTTVTRRSYHRWYVYVAYGMAFTLFTYGVNLGLLESVGLRSMFGFYQPFKVSSDSSLPNMMRGEYFFVARSTGEERRDPRAAIGYLAVVRWPGVEGEYVYRLLGVSGQRISVQDTVVSIDGQALPRRDLCTVHDVQSGLTIRRSVETLDGATHVMQNFDDGSEFARNADEVTVPGGQFFVMGDNRGNANDSRSRGPVANEDFVGRALYVFWSNDWSRIGKSLVPGAEIDRAVYCSPGAK